MGRFRNRFGGAATRTAPFAFAAAPFAAALSASGATAQTSQRIQGSIVVVDPATLSQGAALGARPMPLPAARPGGGPQEAGDVSSARYIVGGLGGDSFSVEV